MYFMMQGDCVVNVKDHLGKEHVAYKMLVEGDHFGEIGMIYKYPRTCTVMSRSYSTLARLTYESYRHVISDHPDYYNSISKNIFRYKDPKLKFLKGLLCKLVYFQNLTIECFYKLLFSMSRLSFEPGDIVLK